MSGIQGTVIESEKGWVTVLTTNGEYKKIRSNRMYYPGELYQGPSTGWRYKYPLVAAVFVLLIISIVDFFNVVTYAQVSSGIELGINRWDRVISVEATDEEAKAALVNTNLQGQKIEDALEIVLDKTLEPLPEESQVTISLTKEGKKDKPLPPGFVKKADSIITQACSDQYKYKYQETQQKVNKKEWKLTYECNKSKQKDQGNIKPKDTANNGNNKNQIKDSNNKNNNGNSHNRNKNDNSSNNRNSNNYYNNNSRKNHDNSSSKRSSGYNQFEKPEKRWRNQ